MTEPDLLSDVRTYLRLAEDTINLGSRLVELFTGGSGDPKARARFLRRRAARHLAAADRLVENDRAQWRIKRRLRLSKLDWQEAQRLDPIDAKLAAASDRGSA